MNSSPSLLEKIFHIKERKSSLKVEALAGVTTFLAMAYIVFVHPDLLAMAGMDKQALITTTCLTAAFGSILMGLFANAPIALAPGMGLNAFFTFGLVLGHGLSWQEALGVVFLSGLLFLLFTLSGIRKHLAKSIPAVIVASATVGIGLFIAFIGLQNMGLIVANPATLVQLGTLKPTVLLSLLGLILMIFFDVLKVKGGLILGILIVTIVALATGLVNLPTSFVSAPPSIAPIALQMDIMAALKFSLISAIFSFMFLDLFDSLGTLLACTSQMGIDKEKHADSTMSKMLYVDVTSTLAGALLGTSTVTSYAESAAGISAGGKTGIAAIITGILFLLALFFTPIISIVPSFATAPAMVMVGMFMFRSIKFLDLSDYKLGIVAFVTIIMMPLTYSISMGLSFGFISYILVHIFSGEFKKIHPILWVIALLCIANLIFG